MHEYLASPEWREYSLLFRIGIRHSISSGHLLCLILDPEAPTTGYVVQVWPLWTQVTLCLEIFPDGRVSIYRHFISATTRFLGWAHVSVNWKKNDLTVLRVTCLCMVFCINGPNTDCFSYF